jgi:diguanylate cyclase (GGDEF)-like protein
MATNTEYDDFIKNDYIGKIMRGGKSAELTSRVKEYIVALLGLEKAHVPIIPYISAWQDDGQVIWYEFVGKSFCDLLHCSCEEVAEVFRRSIIDRRQYRYLDLKEEKVEEEIITKEELPGFWKGLRDAVKESGSVDAVYHVLQKKDGNIWLKDQARIESYPKDGIYISVGFLSDVTKEMELKDLFEKIGYIDEMTRLPKRSILDRILDVNIGNVQRGNINDFVLIMIDVDHFKRVNDTYGHQAGDYVLTSLAEVMKATTRKHDEIGRYGGEEFYGFTVGNMALGKKFAERLRKNVEKTVFEYKGQVIPVTISIGLTSASSIKKDDLSADELIFIADKRLYAAKKAGRNNVVYKD